MKRKQYERSIWDLEIPWKTVIVISVLLGLALSSAGCTTIREHPRLMTAGAVILGTSLALSMNHKSVMLVVPPSAPAPAAAPTEPDPKMSTPLICTFCKP